MNISPQKGHKFYIGVCPDFEGVILPCEGKDALHSSLRFYTLTGWFKGDAGVGYDVKMYGPIPYEKFSGYWEEPPLLTLADVINYISDGIPVEVIDHQDALRLHVDECREELENWDGEDFSEFCFFMDQICWAAYCLHEAPENLIDRKALKWMRSPPKA
jgi:hypothetical protein